jgi:zinc/manganese transport system substrate-binding protein
LEHTVRILSKALLLASALAFAGSCAAQTIFACEPEWAALAQVLLPQARIHVATTHLQDPHHIEARPALIAQVRAADLALCTGAALEEGWLPVLQQKSGNPKIQNGQAGLFWATQGQNLLDRRPVTGSPFEGDVHPDGNPHIHANPQRLLQVAQAMAQRMTQLWPEQGPAIGQRLREFEARWQARIDTWQKRATALRGKTVATQHSYFTYLWEWLGIRPVADLEPKPGLSPTPAHLQQVLKQLQTATPPVLGLAVASHQDPRAARFISQALPTLPVWTWTSTAPQASETGLAQWFDAMLADLNKAATP